MSAKTWYQTGSGHCLRRPGARQEVDSVCEDLVPERKWIGSRERLKQRILSSWCETSAAAADDRTNWLSLQDVRIKSLRTSNTISKGGQLNLQTGLPFPLNAQWDCSIFMMSYLCEAQWSVSCSELTLWGAKQCVHIEHYCDNCTIRWQ